MTEPTREELLRCHRRREVVLDRFEQAWQHGVPDIADFVDADDLDRLYILSALVHSDLDERTRKGWAASLDVYLARFPELKARRDILIDLIVAEWELRVSTSQTPSADEFRARFADCWPEAAARLGAPVAPPAPPDEGVGRGAAISSPESGWPSRISAPAGDVVTPGRSEDAQPRQPTLAGYQVSGLLGRGGMGVVWRAQHLRLGRPVAIKMLRNPQEDEEVLRRFREEAETIARLSHPNVVQVYEVGEWEGIPYLVLELCPGGSLGHRLRAGLLAAREAAKLVETVAGGVQTAHDAGIVHRDLKPDNILFTADNTPKVSDFGLARRLHNPRLTQSGKILGTPSYMSPEQAGRGGQEVGPLADVWALGAVLYECLTGRPPFRAATTLETILQVVEQEPASPRVLNPGVPRDLEMIVLKCLQKVPARRYGSAVELAEDLRRFQSGEAIHARPTPAWERGWRWTRRHPLAAVSVLMVVSLFGMAFAMQGCSAAEREVKVQEALVQEQTKRADLQERLSQEAAKRAKEQSENADKLGRLAARGDYEIGTRQAAARLLAGEPGLAGEELERAIHRPESDSVIGFEWHYLRRQTRVERVQVNAPTGQALVVAWAPDGRTLAVAGTAGIIWLYDTTKWEPGVPFRGHRGAIRGLAYSPDGTRLASAGVDGSVRLWNLHLRTQSRLWAGAHAGGAGCVVFSPVSDWLASGGADGKVHLWRIDAATPFKTYNEAPGPILKLAVDRSGSALAATAGQRQQGNLPQRGEVMLWDLAMGQGPRRWETPHPTRALGFNVEGSLLLIPASGHLVVGHDFKSNSALFEYRTVLDGQLSALAVSPDGRWIALGDDGAAVALGPFWQPTSGVRRLPGHRGGPVAQLAFSPEGASLASVGSDGTVRVWRTGTMRPYRALGNSAKLMGPIALSPDHRTLAALDHDGLVSLYDVRQRCFLRRVGSPHGARELTFAPDGRAVITAGANIRWWDLRTGRRTLELAGQGPGDPLHLAVAGNGCWLVLAGGSASIRVWNLKAPTQGPRTIDAGGQVDGIAFTPDGTKLFASIGSRILSWKTATWKPSAELTTGHSPGKGPTIGPIAVSPDGCKLAAVPSHSRLHVWDLAGNREGLPKSDPGRSPRDYWFVGPVEGVTFTPDSRTILASRPKWGQLAIAEASSVRVQRSIQITDNARGVVAPDGDSFIFSSATGELRSYTQKGERQEDWDAGMLPPVHRLAFSADGSKLRTAAVAEVAIVCDLYPLKASGRVNLEIRGRGAGPVQCWDVKSGRYLGELTRYHGVGTNAASFSLDGSFVALSAIPRACWLYDARNQTIFSTVYTTNEAARIAAGYQLTRLLMPFAVIQREIDAKDWARLHPPTAVAVNASGTELALAEAEKRVSFWDPRTRKPVSGSTPTVGNRVSFLAYSPKVDVLAITHSGTLELWDARQRRSLPALPGSARPAPITGLAYSKNGRWLAVCRDSGECSLWDTAGKCPAVHLRSTGAAATCIAVSPDGRTLVTGTKSGDLLCWNTGLGHAILTLRGHAGLVQDVAFSPDGKRLASAALRVGGRGEVFLWEVEIEP